MSSGGPSPGARLVSCLLVSAGAHAALAAVVASRAQAARTRAQSAIEVELVTSPAPSAPAPLRSPAPAPARLAYRRPASAPPRPGPPRPAPPVTPLHQPQAESVEPPAPTVTKEPGTMAAALATSDPTAGEGAGGGEPAANGILGGTGTAGRSGLGSAEGGAGGSAGPQLGRIRDRIARALNYPAVARRRGWQGCVVVVFTLRPNGGVSDVRVGASSGFEVLDRSAVSAVLSAAPFLAAGDEVRITTPVAFRLE